MKCRINNLREKIESKEYTYRKNEKMRSNIWNFFYTIINEKGEEVDNFFYCIKCGDIKYKSIRATTPLLRHSCLIAQNPVDSNASIDAQTTENLNNAAAKFVCLDLKPLRAIEGDGIRELLKSAIELGKKYQNVNTENLVEKFPSRKVVKSLIAAEAYNAKESIKAIFKLAIAEGGFGCTLDIWSDKYKHNSYMGMTASVYSSTNERIEQKRIVFGMEHITEIVKSKHLLKSKIVAVFEEFDVSPEEIANYITFTSDR